MNYKKITILILTSFITFGGRNLMVQGAIDTNIIINEVLNTQTDIQTNRNIDPQLLEDLGLPGTTYTMTKELNTLVVFGAKSGYTEIYRDLTQGSELVGKLYQGAIGNVLGEEREYYRIATGNVQGYAKKEDLLLGKEAAGYVKTASVIVARPLVDNLALQLQPIITAEVTGRIDKGLTVKVLSEYGDWSYVEAGMQHGYVKNELLSKLFIFRTGETLQEEAERIRVEQESKQRQALVDFALAQLGNPYVYGGTSLTNGVDCSGFTQAVYENFGYSIPRSSREQDDVGTEVSVETMKLGDLLFYARAGRVNHVALYIGDGKIVHASSPKTGIKVSEYDYRQVVKVVSIL